jgi:hypothetical protein
MSRANLMIVVVLILALVGMFFWTLELHNSQAELRGLKSTDRMGGRDAGMVGRLEDLEAEVAALELRVGSQGADLGALDRKVDLLGDVTLPPAEAMAGGELAPTPAAEGVASVGLEAAIETVLEQRAAKERDERRQRMVEGYARVLLADVDATDVQKTEFVKILSDYIAARDAVRQRYSGDNEDDQTRDAETARLEAERDQKVQDLLGAAAFQKMEERLNRSRRGMDGRAGRGGGRGGRPGR